SLLHAVYGVVTLVTVVFFLSKAFASESYSLGGTREGDIFARAGVIWKAGLCFLPLFIADWLSRPDRWIQVSCAIRACLFLVVVDGSRTGLLLVAAIGLGFCGALWWRGELRMMRRKPWSIPLAAGVLLGLLVLNVGMN